MKPRFLLDENVDLVVQRQLRRQELKIEVLAVGDPGTPPLRASDSLILKWIEENNYIRTYAKDIATEGERSSCRM